MVVVKCCVENCSFEGTKRHRFPNPEFDINRYLQWINIINNHSLRLHDPIYVYNSIRICPNHFESCFKPPGTRRLSYNAIPTLNLPVQLQFEDIAESNVAESSVIEDIPTKISQKTPSLRIHTSAGITGYSWY